VAARYAHSRRHGKPVNLIIYLQPSAPVKLNVAKVLKKFLQTFAGFCNILFYYVRKVNGVKLADILFSLLCACLCVSVREHSYLGANISKTV